MRYLPLFLIFLTGCLANNGLGSAAAASNNTYGLARLTIGMTEPQVLAIMRHPYSKKTIEYQGNTYDVWFYVTKGVGLDQSRLVPQNLTPVTFENGILMGWGFDYYKYAMKAQKNKKSPPQELQKKNNDGLNKDLDAIKEVSMSSRPSQQTSSDSSEEDSKEEDESPYLDDDGEKMIDDENDQNFNFW